jgi:hypothetical protein
MTDPAVPQLAMNVQRHQRDADARRCLQLPTNGQIHRCAERYRSHASRAHVSKASLKTTAPALSKLRRAGKGSRAVEDSRTAETGRDREGGRTCAGPGGSSRFDNHNDDQYNRNDDAARD